MSLLVLGTAAVSLDEPCFGLFEVNLQAPGSRGSRRYQVIQVMRGDRVTEFRRDLGPASSFKATQFRIPGGVRDDTTGRIDILHTVGELYDIADVQRYGYLPPPELGPPTDLVGLYHDQHDKNARARRKVSQFGRLHRVQRD